MPEGNPGDWHVTCVTAPVKVPDIEAGAPSSFACDLVMQL